MDKRSSQGDNCGFFERIRRFALKCVQKCGRSDKWTRALIFVMIAVVGLLSAVYYINKIADQQIVTSRSALKAGEQNEDDANVEPNANHGLSDEQIPQQIVPTLLPMPTPSETPNSSTEQKTPHLSDQQLQNIIYQKFPDAGNSQEVSVYFQALGATDGGSVAQFHADDSVVSASTYKLYVAYSMLKAIQNGQSADSDLGGKTLSNCFDIMIINSDNYCPETWMSWHNRLVLDDIYQLGISRATYQRDTFMTSAHDLGKMLEQLNNSDIITDDHRAWLFDDMQRQIYRQGIPAGIGEHGIVMDKVGFLDAYLNDAAICRTDKGDFILVVMTNNSSWGKIAEVTSAIYDAL